MNRIMSSVIINKYKIKGFQPRWSFINIIIYGRLSYTLHHHYHFNFFIIINTSSPSSLLVHHHHLHFTFIITLTHHHHIWAPISIFLFWFFSLPIFNISSGKIDPSNSWRDMIDLSVNFGHYFKAHLGSTAFHCSNLNSF